MTLEQIVDERHDHNDSSRRGSECQSREAFDERCDQGGRKKAIYVSERYHEAQQTYVEERNVSRRRKNLALYLTCMTFLSKRP
jgi:hypothetical protein